MPATRNCGCSTEARAGEPGVADLPARARAELADGVAALAEHLGDPLVGVVVRFARLGGVQDGRADAAPYPARSRRAATRRRSPRTAMTGTAATAASSPTTTASSTSGTSA